MAPRCPHVTTSCRWAASAHVARLTAHTSLTDDVMTMTSTAADDDDDHDDNHDHDNDHDNH